jgi:hypothetical protein
MIEAGVRTGEHLAIITMFADIKSNRAKTQNWSSVASCAKGKEFLLLILCKFVEDFPKPF